MRALAFYARAALATLAFGAVTAVFLPLALVLWGSRRTASWYGRAVNAVALPFLGVRVAHEGRDRLVAAQPCVYVVNHQSNLDILFLGSVYPPNTIIIGKRQIIWLPLFGLFFLATRNLLIDRADRTKAIAGLDKAVAALRERGESIWIFPEGTRNRTSERLGPFKKGAFHMAIEAQVPLVPIVVGQMARHVDFAGRRLLGGTLRIRVLDAIPTTGLTPGDVDALRARTRDAMDAALAG